MKDADIIAGATFEGLDQHELHLQKVGKQRRPVHVTPRGKYGTNKSKILQFDVGRVGGSPLMEMANPSDVPASRMSIV
ncbi:hypothetical protein H310_06382 [Aphanomyces invadans]|uniref:Uncharacterized protein n=1 Tax=Aphanomyces invadans TaxID=157072 RepID=A0A024U6G0_9STRA|nr:hypothetical protein H310_06382 [Aphanomyces invadans]ETW01805.1 hypothetical protein H310_06382 [Aphanomyces invadans]|eukprot:XP_008869653.1 hypothetical protein H310_06382 [Aphanomyces invadans]